MDNQELMQYRNHKVVKSNTLIQKSRHQFSVQQQKALLFLISQLKPEQAEFEWQTFDITEFCEVSGISLAGNNYKDLKDALQGLSDKSLWLILENGDEYLTRWLQNVRIRHRTGKIAVRFDEEMRPFLLELKARYTQWELKYTLAMRSKYAVRLYELLKSYAEMAKDEPIEFTVDRFKTLVGAEYDRWVDVKRYVIDVALREINECSDLHVTYEARKKGRSYAIVRFIVEIKKGFHDKMETSMAVNRRLDKDKKKEKEGATSS